ncbi:MAG: Stp1/IreP family PP2C-type Ser/Thr phosphatase [Bacillota bacterium]
MEVAGLSNKGLRPENQDALYISLSEGLFIVADGMGGHRAGRLASSLAIETARSWFLKYKDKTKDKRELILQSMIQANYVLIQHATQNPETSGMGTTMTLMYLDNGVALIGHVGDSRAYHVSSYGIARLTNDHSYVGELVRMGGITEADALNHPQRNLLLRAIGGCENIEIDFISKPLKLGEHILLCTDGLFNILHDEELKSIIMVNTVNKAVETMVHSALMRGGHDNITAILVKL